jgi:hypothetical protein
VDLPIDSMVDLSSSLSKRLPEENYDQPTGLCFALRQCRETRDTLDHENLPSGRQKMLAS